MVQAEGQVPAVTWKEVRPIWCVDGHGWCTLGSPCLTQRERNEVVSSTTTGREVKGVGLVGAGSCDELEVPHKVRRLDVRCNHARLDQALSRAQFQLVDGRRRCADGDVGPHERAVFDTVAQTGHEDVRFVLEHPGHGQVRLEHGGPADAGVHRRQGHAQLALQRQERLQFHEFHNNIEGRVHASTQADDLRGRAGQGPIVRDLIGAWPVQRNLDVDVNVCVPDVPYVGADALGEALVEEQDAWPIGAADVEQGRDDDVHCPDGPQRARGRVVDVNQNLVHVATIEVSRAAQRGHVDGQGANLAFVDVELDRGKVQASAPPAVNLRDHRQVLEVVAVVGQGEGQTHRRARNGVVLDPAAPRVVVE